MSIETTQHAHTVFLFDRERAELTGIAEVESFHESGIILSSALGDISIEGDNLKIDSFSVESGKITITGSLSGLFYYEKNKSGKNGLFSRRVK